ncbi:MAG: HEPN domain-containing protein [Bacteroidota bacterium]
MTDLQAALFQKAGRAMESARIALEHGDAETTTNRAYYACFHGARAALLDEGEQPKTHSGVHNRFAFQFVASGRISPEVARTLPHAAQIREKADYDALAVTDTRAAADLLADAERFVEAVRGAVGS